MAAIGFLAYNPLSLAKVIYRSPSTAPTAGTSPPINRMPAAPPPQVSGGSIGDAPPRMTAPTAVYPVNVDPTGGSVGAVSTFGGATTSGGTATGFVASQPLSQPLTSPSTTTAGSTTGAGTGGGDSTDSRLLDLLAGAFKPQDISQPYGPIASGPVSSGGGSSATPALFILAFAAIVGVLWWMNHKKKRAA